jgi:hypothetical protein
MRWLRLGLGFSLGVISGVIFGYAWRGHELTQWWLAALFLLLAALITIVAMLRPRILQEAGPRPNAAEPFAPLLGAMLISYRLISEYDLARALTVQRKSGRRLGKVLVDMGLITSAQLAEVLEEQFARREGTFGRHLHRRGEPGGDGHRLSHAQGEASAQQPVASGRQAGPE